MIELSGEVEIARSPEDVFDFVADERNEPLYNPRMLTAEKTSPGPLGLGSEFRAELRARARPVPVTITITAYDRPRLLGSHSRLANMDIKGSLSFEPFGRGTRIRWNWRLEPHGMLRLASPLVRWLGRRREAQVWAGLRDFMERPPLQRAP